MNNFFPVSGPLDDQHQELVDDSLPPELQSAAFKEPDLSPFSSSDIARGRAAWQSRVLEAYGLLIRYTQFAADLAQTRARSEVVGLASRAAWDRDCHFQLCCRMVQYLGGTLKLSSYDFSAYQTKGETAHQRVLKTLVGPICLEETISLRILSELARQAELELARAAILHVARIETRHWQLGWELLKRRWQEIDTAERDELIKCLPEAFRQTERRFYMNRIGSKVGAPTKTESKPSHSFGSMAIHHRASIVSEAMQRAAERFVRLGVPAQSLGKYLDNSELGQTS